MRSTIILMLFSEVRGLFAARTRRLRISRADKKLHEKYGVFLIISFQQIMLYNSPSWNIILFLTVPGYGSVTVNYNNF